MLVIKKILCRICSFIVGLGLARAASVLSREGRYEEARYLMLNEEHRKCFFCK